MKAQTILEVLTGTHLVDAVAKIMSDNFEEFVITQKQCEKATQQLQGSLGESALKAEWDAIQQQFASDLFFSGILGFKANLDNFINPIARNFLDVDYNTYLRETTAHRLPAYVHAQVARDHFYSQLSPAQEILSDSLLLHKMIVYIVKIQLFLKLLLIRSEKSIQRIALPKYDRSCNPSIQAKK
ncbi:MAG: hypothetical protein J6Q53_05380 [Oscillospiraceae bacterium]|nr:hypothetical protein [Oscillospiraceae bacterium]